VRFTAQEEYGLRCMLQLARAGAPGLSIPEVAARESLSGAYVGKLMRVLRQAGLVASTRGKAGGYRLARPAEELSVGQILSALDGPLWSEALCGRYTGGESACVHSSDCSIRALWSALDQVLQGVLRECLLSDLLRTECAMERFFRASSAPA
jgi:Rrf2 family protein